VSAGDRSERRRQVVTPEGVPIEFVVAPAGDRLGALLLDLLLVGATVVVFVVALLLLTPKARLSGDLLGAVALLGAFLTWTCYFPFFELAWRGQTPGKRRLRLRVIDASGGPLRPEAVLARNLTREAELLLPLLALSGGGRLLFPGAPGLAQLVAVGWLLLFGLLPLLNRDRLRVGDLLAGTLVVRHPEAVLLDDLAAHVPAQSSTLGFTDAQLDVYGIYELQVLEQVLRQPGAGRAATLQAVAARIRGKIGWAGTAADEPFLRAFYAALRRRLEHRLLLGRRREDKHHQDR
jgi:uncharacterized RDD family membrane protein YckC